MLYWKSANLIIRAQRGGGWGTHDFYNMNARSAEPADPVLHVYEFALDGECNGNDIVQYPRCLPVSLI